jgi:hypothetical protein
MARYVLSLASSIALILLASVLVVHTVDCFFSTDDATIATYVVGLIAFICMVVVAVMHDEWRCRLVLEANVESYSMVSMG